MTRSKRNSYLHGARGIFSFAVFLFHILNSTLAPAIPDALALVVDSPQYGVELFFGISGIVIIGARRNARTMAQFLLERCTRIYPVLWATIFAILIIELLTHKSTMIAPGLTGLAVLAANLLAIPNAMPTPDTFPLFMINPAAWTLSYEFCFYILVGLFLSPGVKSSGALRLCIALAGIWLLSRQFRAVFFVSGIAIYAGLFERGILLQISRFPLILLAAFLGCWTLANAWLGLPVGLVHVAQAGRSQPAIPVLLLAGWISGTLALAGIVRGEGLLGRLCQSPAAQWLGTVSYSLYLWQAAILGGIHHVLISTGLGARVGDFGKLLLFAAALPPLLIVSKLSQRFLEVRATNWLRGKLEGRGANQHQAA